jgi:hypothetical protein
MHLYSDEDALVAACFYIMMVLEYQATEKRGIGRPAVNGKLESFESLPPTAIIEVAKIYEAGARKYEPRNWEKGIPMSRFLDSGLRHFMKFMRGDDDEPHLAQAVWNFLCLLDTKLRIRDGLLPGSLYDLPLYVEKYSNPTEERTLE